MTENILAGAATSTETTTTEQLSADWRTGLSDDYREKYTEFKDVNSLMKGYEGLVSKLGQNPIVRPKDDAPDDVKAEYFNSLKKELGAPDNVDGYKFDLPEDLPENFIDDKQLGDMKELFLQEGVPAATAEKIISKYAEGQLDAFNTLESSQDDAMASAETALKEAWGDEYDGNLNKASAFADKYLSKETVDSMGNNPHLIKDILNLYNQTAENRIDSQNMEVKHSSTDLREEAVQLMRSADYTNPMSPNHKTVRERVSDLYKRAGDMEAGVKG